MKIVLTSGEVEEAVEQYLKEARGIDNPMTVYWNEAGLVHPVHPIIVDVAE